LCSIIDKLVQEVASLRDQLQAAHRHVDHVDEQLLRVAQRNESEVAQQVAALSLQVAEKNALLEASEAQRQQLQADLQRAQADRDFLTRSLGELEHAQTQLSNLLQAAEQLAQEKQQHNEKTEAETSLLRAQLTALHARADTMVGELSRATAERSRCDSELASLRDVTAQAQEAMREQQEALEKVAFDREHAIAQLSNALQEAAAMRAEATTAWKSHAELSKRVEVADTALLSKIKECEHLEAARRNLAATVAELEHSNAQLQQSCTTISASSHMVSDRMHEELENLRRENEVLARQLQTKNSALKQLSAESQSAQSRNVQLQQQLKEFELTLVARLDESSAVLASVEAAGQQTGVLQAQLAAKVMELRTMQQSVDELSVQVKELEQSRGELAEQLSSTRFTQETEHNNNVQLDASYRTLNDRFRALQADFDVARADAMQSQNSRVQLQAQLEHVLRERAQVLEQLESATSLIQSLRQKVVPTTEIHTSAAALDAHAQDVVRLCERVAAAECSNVHMIRELTQKLDALSMRCDAAERLVESHSQGAIQRLRTLHAKWVAEIAVSRRLTAQLDSAQANERAAAQQYTDLEDQFAAWKSAMQLVNSTAPPRASASSPTSVGTQTQEVVNDAPYPHIESVEELASECRALRQLVEVQNAQNLGLQNEVLLHDQCRQEYQAYAAELAEKFTSIELHYDGVQINADELARQLHEAQDHNATLTAEVTAAKDQLSQLQGMLSANTTQVEALVAENNALRNDADVAHQEYTDVRSQLERSLESIQAQVQLLQQEVERTVVASSSVVRNQEDNLLAQLELERSLLQQAQISLRENDATLKRTQADLDSALTRCSLALLREQEQQAVAVSNQQLIASLQGQLNDGVERYTASVSQCRRLHETLLASDTLLKQTQDQLERANSQQTADLAAQQSMQESLLSMTGAVNNLERRLQEQSIKCDEAEAGYKQLLRVHAEANYSSLSKKEQLSTLQQQAEDSSASSAALAVANQVLQASLHRSDEQIEVLSTRLQEAMKKLSAAETIIEERTQAANDAAEALQQQVLQAHEARDTHICQVDDSHRQPSIQVRGCADTCHVRVVRSCATQTTGRELNNAESNFTTPDSSQLHVSHDSSSDLTVSSLRRKVTSQSRALVASHKREFERDRQIEHLTRLALRNTLQGHLDPFDLATGAPRWSGAESRISSSDPLTYFSPAYYAECVAPEPSAKAKLDRETIRLDEETDKPTGKTHESVRLRRVIRCVDTPSTSTRRLSALKPVSKELILHDTPGPGQTVKLIARCEFFPSPASDPMVV
jgi:chromosome segregation ATPase